MNTPDSDAENPLASDDARSWEQVVEAVGPASLLVVIDRRMGTALRQKLSAEDIWQEVLLQAWRDRANCQWAGLASFRRWLLGIIDHRIRDAIDFFNAKKRGRDEVIRSLQSKSGLGTRNSMEPRRSTTPSRLAVYREQAEQMSAALSELPGEMRDVVRLRLFEGLQMNEVADQLGIGLSAAKHRFRKGAALYRARLFARLGSSVGRRAARAALGDAVGSRLDSRPDRRLDHRLGTEHKKA